MSASLLRRALVPQLKLSPEEAEEVREDEHMQDLVTGILILKAELSQLSELVTFPDVLERAGFSSSKIALLYALGEEREAASEANFEKTQTEEQLHEFFELWVDQPASNQLANSLQLSSPCIIRLKSIVLGVEIKLEAESNLRSLYLAEAFLGSIEAFFATSLNQKIIPFQEEVRVYVGPREDNEKDFVIRTSERNGDTFVDILHPHDPTSNTPQMRKKQRDALQEAIIRVMTTVAYVENPKKYLE